MIILMLMAFRLIFPLSHGDLDLRIEEISRQIQRYPDSLTLYLKRGELYLQHEEYSNAKRDFSKCINGGLVDPFVLMGISEAYLNEGDPDSALFYVSRVVRSHPTNVSGLELQAKAFMSADKYCEAANTYEQLIVLPGRPSPIIFIQCADAFAQCTREGSSEKSITILHQGILQNPANTVLKKHLVSTYLTAKLFDEALAIQATIINHASFKSRHYLERAKIYILLQRFEEARMDFDLAIKAIEDLPPSKKDLPAIENLRKDILTHLTELN